MSNSPQRPLFKTLLTAFDDSDQQFREALFAAARQDFPDLDAILEAELSKTEPSRDFQRLTRHISQFSAMGSVVSGNADPLFLDFVANYFPLHAWQPAAGNAMAPGALSLSDSAFNRLLSGPNADKSAARLLASVLRGAHEDGAMGIYSDPVVAARIETLLGVAPPEEVGAICARMGTANLHFGKIFDHMAQREESWAKKLAALYDTHVKPLRGNAHPSSDTHGYPTNNGGEDILLPEHGATAMLLDARAKLLPLLRKADGAWLNQPAAWQAARNTFLQTVFIDMCAKTGAFNESAKGPDTTDGFGKDADNNQANALLAGLDIPSGDRPKAREANAWQAVEGYFDGIQSAADLVAALALTNRSQVKEGGPYYHLIENTAARVGFGPEDALSLALHPETRNGDIKHMIGALSGGRWTAQAFDALLTERPVLGKAKQHVDILNAILDTKPDAIAELSDRGIFQLVRALNYDIQGTELRETAHKQVEARIGALGSAEKTLLLAAMITKNTTPDKNKPYIQAILGGIEQADLPGFLLASSKINDNPIFYTQIRPFLSSDIMQEELVGELSDLSHSMYFLDQLEPLLGYRTGFDKAKTLSMLDETIQRRSFCYLASRLLSDFHPDAPSMGTAQQKSVWQNMMFDLNEHISALPMAPTTLGLGSILVQQGIAKAGDQLTWDGFTHLVAPYLEGERPPVIEANIQSASPAAAQTGHLLDANTIKERLQGNSGRAQADPLTLKGRLHCTGIPPHAGRNSPIEVDLFRIKEAIKGLGDRALACLGFEGIDIDRIEMDEMEIAADILEDMGQSDLADELLNVMDEMEFADQRHHQRRYCATQPYSRNDRAHHGRSRIEHNIFEPLMAEFWHGKLFVWPGAAPTKEIKQGNEQTAKPPAP